MIVASTVIFMYGISATGELEHRSSMEQAKLSIAETDRCLSTEAYHATGGADCLDDEYDLFDGGELEVFVNGDRRCSTSTSFGTLEREVGDAAVAYQAGGRFQRTESGSTLLSEPDITYTSRTIDGEDATMLDISLVNVTGSIGSGENTVSQAGSEREDFGECVEDRYVESVTMYVNGSPFHDAWARFLEDEFGEDSVSEPATDSIKVTAALDGGRSVNDYVDIDPVIYGGVHSTKSVTLENHDNLSVRTLNGERDWSVIHGTLGLKPNSELDSEVGVTGDVDPQSSGQGGNANVPAIGGTLYYGGDNDGGANVSAERVPALESVTELPSIDDEIESVREQLADAEPIDGDTVTAGEYFATESQLRDVETIDTSDGDVHIGANETGNVDISDVTVAGGGRVHFYLDDDVKFTGETGSDDADQLWIYGSSNAGVTIDGDFTGVVYAPDGAGNGVKLFDGSTVEGAVVGPLSFVSQNGKPHNYSITFDESLRTHTLLDRRDPGGDLDTEDDEIDASEFDNATLSVVDQQVAQDRVVGNNTTVRQPLDVAFVLDRSGSMGVHDPDGDYTSYDNTDWEPVPFNGDFAVANSRRTDDIEFVEIKDSDDNERTVGIGESGTFKKEEEYRLVTDCSIWSGCDPNADLVHPGNDPDGLRVDATKNFIGQMNESIGDRAGVVEFTGWSNELHELDSDLDDVNESLRAVARGGTNMNRGLEEALDQDFRNDDDANRVVILLSDGENDNTDIDERTRERAEDAADRNITIHTIGLGDYLNEELLEDVADETGGQYHHVDDAEQLEDIFEDVGEDVTGDREYVIENKEVETNVSGSALPPEDGEWELDPNETVSLAVNAYGCDGWNSTGETVENESGEEFEEVTCDGTDLGNGTEVNGSTSVHDYGVYAGGDDVPNAHYTGEERGWWQDDFEADLESQGLASDGDFDLEPGQAVVVVQFQGNDGCADDESCEEPYGYAIYLFEGSAGDEITVNPPDDHGSAATGSNTYVINIVETELEVDGDE